MLWQDYVLTAGSIVFSVALVPAVLAKEKPPLSTSVPTFFFLYLFSFVYFTLSLWLSMITTAITGMLWLILAVQRHQRTKGSKGWPQQIEKRQHNLDRIIALAKERRSITNNDVERTLHVSDATAERYLSELESSGALEQVGTTGKFVSYQLRR